MSIVAHYPANQHFGRQGQSLQLFLALDHQVNQIMLSNWWGKHVPTCPGLRSQPQAAGARPAH